MNSILVHKPWPPTPKDIIESDKFVCLFNLIAWTVSTNAAMGKEGFFGLSYGKPRKISEIAQMIQSLVLGGKTCCNQILVYNNHVKTGLQMVVNNLKQ